MSRAEYAAAILEANLPDLSENSVKSWLLNGCDLIDCPNDFGEGKKHVKRLGYCDSCSFKDYWDKEMPDERSEQ